MRFGFVALLACMGLSFALVGACATTSSSATGVRWLGQSCFLITSKAGVRLLTDPYNPHIGYQPIKQRADVVTVSHEHFDHNATDQVLGRFEVVRGSGTRKIDGITVTGVPASHGRSPEGQSLGADTIFVIEVDGLRICHLGDLGTLLSLQQVKEIGRVDVLLIPVGGYYAIDAAQAWKVVGQLDPKVVIPMHYKTAANAAQIPQLAGVEPFLQGRKNVQRAAALSLTPATLPKTTTVFVLSYEH